MVGRTEVRGEGCKGLTLVCARVCVGTCKVCLCLDPSTILTHMVIILSLYTCRTRVSMSEYPRLPSSFTLWESLRMSVGVSSVGGNPWV